MRFSKCHKGFSVSTFDEDGRLALKCLLLSYFRGSDELEITEELGVKDGEVSATECCDMFPSRLIPIRCTVKCRIGPPPDSGFMDLKVPQETPLILWSPKSPS